MAEIQLGRREVEWVNQPCGEPRSFTTTGVDRTKQKVDSPTMADAVGLRPLRCPQSLWSPFQLRR